MPVLLQNNFTAGTRSLSVLSLATACLYPQMNSSSGWFLIEMLREITLQDVLRCIPLHFVKSRLTKKEWRSSYVHMGTAGNYHSLLCFVKTSKQNQMIITCKAKKYVSLKTMHFRKLCTIIGNQSFAKSTTLLCNNYTGCNPQSPFRNDLNSLNHNFSLPH